MEDQSTHLNELLTDCMKLLQSVGETFWSEKIEAVVERGISPFAARSILEWYGGMGSFTDLLICRINGHDVEVGDEPEINKRLSALRTEIYKKAGSFARSN